MSEHFDIIVPIKEDLKKTLIFGFKSRPTIALSLGFLGYRHEVLPLLQTISHATRAYIYHENGLPGFIFRFDIIKILKSADEKGQLKDAREWQEFDLDLLREELAVLNRPQKMRCLSQYYPSLYRYMLTHFEQNELLGQYTKECQSFIEHPQKFCYYIHGYFVPLIQQQREAGKIKYGVYPSMFNLSLYRKYYC